MILFLRLYFNSAPIQSQVHNPVNVFKVMPHTFFPAGHSPQLA
jgi:hypothetical protein